MQWLSAIIHWFVVGCLHLFWCIFVLALLCTCDVFKERSKCVCAWGTVSDSISEPPCLGLLIVVITLLSSPSYNGLNHPFGTLKYSRAIQKFTKNRWSLTEGEQGDDFLKFWFTLMLMLKSRAICVVLGKVYFRIITLQTDYCWIRMVDRRSCCSLASCCCLGWSPFLWELPMWNFKPFPDLKMQSLERYLVSGFSLLFRGSISSHQPGLQLSS